MRALPIATALVLGLLCLTSIGPAAADEGPGADHAPLLRAGLVRVHATSQSRDRTSPWKMGRPASRTGRGVVIGPGRILTPASIVTNARMVEVSLAGSARRFPATLLHRDGQIGLALVEVDPATLPEKLAPIPLGDPIRLDDTVRVNQLDGQNMPQGFDGRVVRARAWSTTLQLTLKTGCSDRGDGQAVLRQGRLVGLVTSTWSSRQEATVISLETLRHYLDDFNDDAYHGCPGDGPWTQPLLREDLRTGYRMDEGRHGVLVTRVHPGRTGDGVLQADDVLLSVDGYDIDDEGKFEHERHGRLSLGWLFEGRRYAGDTLPVVVWRDGKEHSLQVELKGEPKGEKRIPNGTTSRPEYLVAGGFVFLELNSRSPISRSAGGVILRRYREREGWDAPTARRRIVYVDRVIPDDANKGFEDVRQLPVLQVNGRDIHEIADVVAALEAPQGDFHVIRFEGVASDVVIPAASQAAVDARIAKAYKIPELRWIRRLDAETGAED